MDNYNIENSQNTILGFISFLTPSWKGEDDKYECPVCKDKSHNLSISKIGEFTCYSNHCDTKEIFIAAKKLAGQWVDRSGKQSGSARPRVQKAVEKTIENYYKLNGPELPKELGNLISINPSDAGLKPVEGRPFKAFKDKNGLDRKFNRRFVYQFDEDHVTERIEWDDDSEKGYSKEVRPRNKEQDGQTWVAKKGEKFPPYKLDLITAALKNNPNGHHLLPIAEGEQNCELFRSIGILSTTAQAANWDDKTFKQLADVIKGYSVTLVVLIDNDSNLAGQSKAKKVCESAIKYGVPYLIIFYNEIYPEVPEHGDIKDCLKLMDKDVFLSLLQKRLEISYKISAQRITKKSLSPKERDQELRLTFGQISLSSAHREKLINLGIKEEWIESGWFRSLPRLCRLKNSVHPLTPGVEAGKFLPKYKGIVVPIFQGNLILGYEILLDNADRLGETQVISSHKRQAKLEGKLPLMILEGNQEQINLVGTDDAYASCYNVASKTGYETLGGDISCITSQLLLRGELSTKTIIFYPDHKCFVNTKSKLFYKWQNLAHSLLRKGHTVRVAYWGQKDSDIKLKDVDFSKIEYLEWETFAKKFSLGYAEYVQNKRFTATKKVNQRYLNPEDCGFTVDKVQANTRTLNAIKADTGTGKTESAYTLVKIAKEQGKGGIALHELNSVSLQSCKRLGFNHLNLGDNINLIYQDESWLSLCINSTVRLYPENFYDAIVIIDEAESVARALTNEGTLKGKTRREVQAKISELETSKMIVLMDANLSNKTVEFFAAVAKIDKSNIIKIENDAKSEYGKVNIALGKKQYEPAIMSAIGQVVTLKAAGQNSVIICDSQALCEKIEMRLVSMGLGEGILRIDSKTKSGKETKDVVHQFLESPDKVLQEVKPWLLIMSPTVKAGVSINKTQTWELNDDMVGTLNDAGHYFSKGFFFRSFIDTDSAIQMLGRVRDSIDWDIWSESYSRKDDDQNNIVMKAITQRYETLSAAHKAQLEENLSSEAIADIFKNFDLNELNNDPYYVHHIKQAQIINYDKTALGENLIREMHKQGRDVKVIELSGKYSLKEESEEIRLRESTRIFDAGYMDIVSARKVIQSWTASEDELYKARKAIFLDMHPGIEHTDLWSVELVQRMLFKDKDMSKQIYRRWLWLNPDKAKEVQMNTYQLIGGNEFGIFFPDVDSDPQINNILLSLGFGNLINQYLAGDEIDIKAIEKLAKKLDSQGELFGRVGKYPLRYVNQQLKRFGLEAKKNKEGTSVVIKDKYLAKGETESEITLMLMQCFDRKYDRQMEQKNQAQTYIPDSVRAEKDDPELSDKNGSSIPYFVKKYSQWIGKKVKFWSDRAQEWITGTLKGQRGDNLWEIATEYAGESEICYSELDLKGDGWVLA